MARVRDNRTEAQPLRDRATGSEEVSGVKIDLVRRKEGKGVREPMAATTPLPEAEMGAPMH